MTFLYVDDDPDDGDIFRAAVEEADPSVFCHVVVDAAEMLQSINIQSPDYIFVDHNIPGSSSQKIIRLIKSTQCSAHAKIILYSNFISEEDLRDCKQLGAEDCWIKPASYFMLCDWIRKLLLDGTR